MRAPRLNSKSSGPSSESRSPHSTERQKLNNFRGHLGPSDRKSPFLVPLRPRLFPPLYRANAVKIMTYIGKLEGLTTKCRVSDTAFGIVSKDVYAGCLPIFEDQFKTFLKTF